MELQQGLRWFGSALAASACVVFGFAAASLLRKREVSLQELLRILRLLSRRIVLLYEPMSEALYALSSESPLFLRVQANMDLPPAQAWQTAMAPMKELTTKDKQIVSSLMEESGSAGRAEQEQIFAVGLLQLEEHIIAARKSVQSDAQLYRTLGVLAGVVIIILAL